MLSVSNLKKNHSSGGNLFKAALRTLQALNFGIGVVLNWIYFLNQAIC
jgi:hypothetical protein